MSKKVDRCRVWGVRLVVGVLFIAFTILWIRAFDARGLPDLELWHRVDLNSEFRVGRFHQGMSFEDYLEVEREVFEELDERVYGAYESAYEQPFNRYVRGSVSDPEGYEQNWNRSFELVPDEIRGGILLLHGLTDSPYSVRTIAEIFCSQGYYVLCPRLPGHGTVPSGIATVGWRDWVPVVEMAARHVRKRIGRGAAFYLGGYSNGGTLAVKYVLDSFEDEGLESPERLYLFSPAIGVTRYAVVANWHKILSFHSYFEKFRWQSIGPEFDPFKYNSFPKNAGDQTYLLAKAVQAQLDGHDFGSAGPGFPPILTFQSVVDSTVVSADVIEKLYNRLAPNGSELVLFDVNRCGQLKGFIRQDYRTVMSSFEATASGAYELTVVTNTGVNSLDVVAKTRGIEGRGGDVEDLGLSWPRQVFSLSHVAIPFPVDDPIYGDGTGAGEAGTLQIGALVPRGERSLLTIPTGQLMRLRHNPFFSYMKHRIVETVSQH